MYAGMLPNRRGPDRVCEELLGWSILLFLIMRRGSNVTLL